MRKQCVRLGCWVAVALAAVQAYGGVLVPGDYNADGLADLALHDGVSGRWTIRGLSGESLASGVVWGGPGYQSVPGDYDGDGIADLAVYATDTGAWYIRTLSGTILLTGAVWGAAGMMPVPGDYDGDGISDLIVRDAATGRWYWRPVSGATQGWGAFWSGAGLTPVPGDYDGDGQSDVAVYEESTGRWRICGSGMGLIWEQTWGGPGLKPVSGDFDGDGIADLAVRNDITGQSYAYSIVRNRILANGQVCGVPGYAAAAADFDGDFQDDLVTYDAAAGIWNVTMSRSGYAQATVRGFASESGAGGVANLAGRRLAVTYAPTALDFEQAGLVAFVADFNGDGVDEVGAFHAASGTWYLRDAVNQVGVNIEFGGPGMEPVVGDYDGDGKSDLAVFVRATAMWVIEMSAGHSLAGQFGSATCTPVPADYDGDGLTDAAFYEPGTGYWTGLLSASGAIVSQLWGFPGAQAVPADFDGDGRADLAVFEPDQARWYIQMSGGGSVIGLVFGWSGCRPFPADFDHDGKADLAVYWAAGGQWMFRSSAHDFVWNGIWTPAPGISDPVRCQVVSARFGIGTDRRVCVLDTVTGRMLLEPDAPQVLSMLGSAMQPLQDLKALLDPVAARPRRAVGEVIEAVLGIAESVIEDFEQEERDAKIDEMNGKLDAIAANLKENTKQLNNLMVQLNTTRDYLEATIWQATLAAAIKQLRNTHNELQKFNGAAYRRLSSGARAIKVAQYQAGYGQRDILGSLSDMHTHIVGEGASIPSSMRLWNNLLVAKVKAGQSVILSYRSLEAFFTELLGYEMEGLQVYGHHTIYKQGDAGREVFEDYILDTFIPRMAAQTAMFLECVDELAAASLDLRTEAAALPAPSLPAGVAGMYQAADFLAAAISTGTPWGLTVHILGEPGNVAAYLGDSQVGYYAAPDTNMTVHTVSFGDIHNVDTLQCPSYLGWYWRTNGTFGGYNMFKTETHVAVAAGTVSNLAVGDYIVCAPWGVDPRGRQIATAVRNHDSHMRPLGDTATNGVRFGSAVLYVRSQPSLCEGWRTQTQNFLMGGNCFAFPKEISIGRGEASVRVRTETYQNTPCFWMAPHAADEAALILPVYNGNAGGTNVTFDISVDISLAVSSDRMWSYFCYAQYGESAGFGQWAVLCGDWWWSGKLTLEAWTTSAARSDTHRFDYAVPAGTWVNMSLMNYQRTIWGGGVQWYPSGTWNETRMAVKSIRME